jgi:hypothetical protein
MFVAYIVNQPWDERGGGEFTSLEKTNRTIKKKAKSFVKFAVSLGTKILTAKGRKAFSFFMWTGVGSQDR